MLFQSEFTQAQFCLLLNLTNLNTGKHMIGWVDANSDQRGARERHGGGTCSGNVGGEYIENIIVPSDK